MPYKIGHGKRYLLRQLYYEIFVMHYNYILSWENEIASKIFQYYISVVSFSELRGRNCDIPDAVQRYPFPICQQEKPLRHVDLPNYATGGNIVSALLLLVRFKVQNLDLRVF